MAKTLDEIKQSLKEHLGQDVTIKANGGRKKMIERSGQIESVYPCVFTVKLDRDKYPVERMSYSYTDVLTETVQLTMLEKA
ncbi:Veg family protein [Salisediminibacterium halotolerans]|uniref:Uncharacterized protein Veg n=1 Tax=Salisediminibacterium halotolerans TaxID=517425 RepID=A0A1H9VRY7_9BACI|nr:MULTISPECIES: Veg family protein [Salisediminibacterium]RLJ80958.1 uncharacterized protein Veg [Actinophytocola xinjiangensis]RPE83637.1 uncharacterized protein Veg [Salisediminibacterium halotolerans]TWG37883.1 uncharacterized protein Veg [Salisediminibacterium halotolerans]SES24254.1 Uncharacterized protein Veg [Salisediminibacterium haloalkalitolerans]GEL07015.1 protein Veg [Salisediminibacterium halotolerans]